MATYHAFAGYYYYPEESLGDYVGGFLDLDEAVAAVAKVAANANCDWYSIASEDHDHQLAEVYNSKQGHVPWQES